MKIAILTPSISRLAGGMFFSVRHLSKELVARGVSLKVFSNWDEYSQQDLKMWQGVTVKLYKSNLGKFGYSRQAYKDLLDFYPDMVHLNGIWTYQSILTTKMANRGVKTIIAPRGMIDCWALKSSPLRKSIAIATYEKSNFLNAGIIHALCNSEAESVRKIFPKANIQVVPNGIYIPVKSVKDIKKINFNERRLILGYIGRLDVKKGIVNLLLAMSYLQLNFPMKLPFLLIAGWGDVNYVNQLKEMVVQLGLSDIVQFVGQVYGEEKEEFLNRIDAFVLPSYSEGLPMAVLDCWARSIPVIMTDECNLQFSFLENAALRISHDPKNIAQVILSFINKNPEEIKSIGDGGLAIARRRYSWPTVVNQTIEMFLSESGQE